MIFPFALLAASSLLWQDVQAILGSSSANNRKIPTQGPQNAPAPVQASPDKVKKIPPKTIPLEVFFMNIDLQWFGDIAFGTPPQTFTTVFDTGGFNCIFPGQECHTCGKQKLFNTEASTTFVDEDRVAEFVFGTGAGTAPQEEDLFVEVIQDVATLAGIDAGPMLLGLIINETAGLTNDPFDAICGMAFSLSVDDTVFAGLVSQGMEALFSFILKPHTIGGSEITLGGVSNKIDQDHLTYFPLSSSAADSGLWLLDITEISVNGRTNKNLSSTRLAQIDTGTSNADFDMAAALAIYALISKDIKPHGPLGMDGLQAFGIECNKIPLLQAEIGLTFVSESGKPVVLTIPTEEFNLGPFTDDTKICQTLINAIDIGFSVVGASFLKHYNSVFDITNSRIGFSPAPY